jgi:hypothetical protein
MSADAGYRAAATAANSATELARNVTTFKLTHAALAGVVLLPVLLKLVLGDLRTNLVTGLALLLLAFLLGLRFNRDWLRETARQVVGGFVILFGVFAAAWQWQVGDLWLNGQLVLYLGAAAAFVGCVAWFRRQGAEADALVFLLEIKVGTVVGASVLILLALLAIPDDPDAQSGQP